MIYFKKIIYRVILLSEIFVLRVVKDETSNDLNYGKRFWKVYRREDSLDKGLSGWDAFFGRRNGIPVLDGVFADG